MDIVFELEGLQFEWDARKYASNLWKHNIRFEEAAEVFFDESYQFGDASVDDEMREFIIGFSFKYNLLYTVYVERGERIRIISARTATKEEEKRYDKRK